MATDVDTRSRIVQDAVNDSITVDGEVGVQVAAYLNGKLVIDVWAGEADPDTGRKVDGDTVFTTFFIKPITASALHIQASRGLVEYDAPVARYWPEFAQQGKGKATVRDVLGHNSGVPHMPDGVTPELMCDWNWMVEKLAASKPLFKPGTKSGYQSMTHGWLIGEIVRRTDPKNRPFGQFVQDEVCRPLGIDSLWIGIPDEVEPRVAKLINAPGPNVDGPHGTLPKKNLEYLAVPSAVGFKAEVYGRPDVMRSCIPGSDGIMNARSAARFFAMLANRGELDGVRLMAKESALLYSFPRQVSWSRDVIGGVAMPWLSQGGSFTNNGVHESHLSPWERVIGRNPATAWHIGAGSSVGWADPDRHLAVAICHNRLFYPTTPEDNVFTKIADSVRTALGVPA